VVPWVICGVGGAAAVVGWGVLGGMAMSSGDHDQAVIADIIGVPPQDMPLLKGWNDQKSLNTCFSSQRIMRMTARTSAI